MRSFVYWFLPTRPLRAGGLPVFLWEDLGGGGSGKAGVGSNVVGGLLTLPLTVRRGGSGVTEPNSAIDSQNTLSFAMRERITIILFSTAFIPASVCWLLLLLGLAITHFFIPMGSSCSAPYVLKSFWLLRFFFRIGISAATFGLGGRGCRA